MSGGGFSSSEIHHLPEHNTQATTSKNQQNPPTSRGFLTLRQLIMIAIAAVLSANGLVPMEDFGFVVFSLIYMYFISKFSFPILSPSMEPRVFGQDNKILGLYVSFAAVIGLFLPMVYILEGIFGGHKSVVKAAAPHIFLLASQVFMEGVAFSDRFSLPIRVFVPVFYNSRRIFSIIDWLRDDFSRVDGQNSGSGMRFYVGRGLAAANMALWCFNLFGFLLPVYLPKAFKIYYSLYRDKETKVT